MNIVVTTTVDLVRSHPSSAWHIRRDAETTLCAFAIPEGAKVEAGVDARVVTFRGKQVCSRCRRVLGGTR